MATGRGLDQIFGPGELYINPTDLTGTSGTGLGYTEDGVVLRPNLNAVAVRPDERGVELLKKIHGGVSWMLAANLIQWNATLAARLFPGTDVQYRKTLLLGSEITPVKLLYVPEDTTNNPCIYFRKAVGNIEASAAIRLSLGERPRPAVFPIVFENATAQDSSYDDSVQIALLANIVLN